MTSTATRARTSHVGLAITARALGGFAIGTTEFVTMGLLVGGMWSLAALYGFAFLALTAWVGYRHKWIRKTGIPSPVTGTYVRGEV